MNKIEFAYYMEARLQEMKTWPREPGYYEYDDPDYAGGPMTSYWNSDKKMIKQNRNDINKLQKQGIRDASGNLTAKGRTKEANSYNRFNKRGSSVAIDVVSGR